MSPQWVRTSVALLPPATAARSRARWDELYRRAADAGHPPASGHVFQGTGVGRGCSTLVEYTCCGEVLFTQVHCSDWLSAGYCRTCRLGPWWRRLLRRGEP